MKRWENPDLGSLKVCCTKTKAIGPCGAEVNIEGEGNNSGKLNVKCMDWTRGHQKFDDGVCIYATDKWGNRWKTNNNGNAYCSGYKASES